MALPAALLLVQACERHEPKQDKPAAVEAQDLGNLAGQKKVAWEVSAASIMQMELRLKRLVPEPIEVLIPRGMYFVSSEHQDRNRVATAAILQTLISDDWTPVKVPAAVVGKPALPYLRGSYTLGSAGSSLPAGVGRVLAEEEHPHLVFQAALWIAGLDYDYSDLGVVIERNRIVPIEYAAQTRVIREDDAVRAMRIVDQAGIDIAERKIWMDRQSLYWRLNDAAQREWLEGRDATFLTARAQADGDLEEALASVGRSIVAPLHAQRWRVYIAIGSDTNGPIAAALAHSLRRGGHQVEVGDTRETQARIGRRPEAPNAAYAISQVLSSATRAPFPVSGSVDGYEAGRSRQYDIVVVMP